MPSISMTLNEDNHLSVVTRIVDEWKGKKFNILVDKFTLGSSTAIQLKFCNRMITGNFVKNGLQVSVPLEPGGSIAWDLRTELVVVRFDSVGEIIILRLFDNRQRSKTMKITKNPI